MVDVYMFLQHSQQIASSAQQKQIHAKLNNTIKKKNN
jgi:hypothetical protein